MLLIRWLQNILLGPLVSSMPAGRQATYRVQESGKAPGVPRADSTLLDVVREALREEAAELTDLVARGVPAIQRRRLRRRVRQRVAQAMHPAFDSPEVVEEVTERLVSAAEVDPYYTRLFEDGDTDIK